MARSACAVQGFPHSTCGRHAKRPRDDAKKVAHKQRNVLVVVLRLLLLLLPLLLPPPLPLPPPPPLLLLLCCCNVLTEVKGENG